MPNKLLVYQGHNFDYDNKKKKTLTKELQKKERKFDPLISVRPRRKLLRGHGWELEGKGRGRESAKESIVIIRYILFLG